MCIPLGVVVVIITRSPALYLGTSSAGPWKCRPARFSTLMSEPSPSVARSMSITSFAT